jgi:hypothetical protein
MSHQHMITLLVDLSQSDLHVLQQTIRPSRKSGSEANSSAYLMRGLGKGWPPHSHALYYSPKVVPL